MPAFDWLVRSRAAGLVALATGAVALAWATWSDVGSGTRPAERLMQDQARSLADLVRESGSHGFDTYRLWEDEVAARLLDNAHWIARLDSARPLDSLDLARIARDRRLSRINLFDATGRKTASSQLEDDDTGLPPRHDPRDYIAPILRGEVRELRIGFKPARFRGGSRFAVAVARRNGGALVVNVFADSMRAVLENVSPGHLMSALGSAGGLRYVVLQSGDSLLGASAGAPLAALASADDVQRAIHRAGDAITRERAMASGPVYEVARTVDFPGAPGALLRVGLDARPLQRAREAIRTRALSRVGVFLVAAALVSSLMLARQRHGVLEAEIARTSTELEAREREAQRTARLTAMGELAAHVAHEIRNPLSTIHMTAQQMTRDPALGDDLRTRAEDVRAESRRIEEIVQQFLTFAKPRAPMPRAFDLHEAVSAAARRAEPAFEVARVVLDVNAEGGEVRLDRAFVDEILDNLLRNAREACSAGGRVVLASRVTRKGVRLEVQDDGHGVPPELHERIFDLYFTTRSEGTGLGLPLVAQMAAAMGGAVRHEQPPECGARFVVRLPARMEDA